MIKHIMYRLLFISFALFSTRATIILIDFDNFQEKSVWNGFIIVCYLSLICYWFPYLAFSDYMKVKEEKNNE